MTGIIPIGEDRTPHCAHRPDEEVKSFNRHLTGAAEVGSTRQEGTFVQNAASAILNNEVVVVGGHGALIFDLTAWGWIQLIVGLLVALTGLGLLMGNEIARVLGVFLLVFNAILQIVWFTAAPLWAILIIALDVIIIYQLMMGWTEDEA